jgi:hypothetical protein
MGNHKIIMKKIKKALISVSDKNIKVIYSMVKTGTPILIKP